MKSELINFRTPAQKDQYTPLTKRKGLKYFLKNCFFLLNYRTRKQKYLNFEEFIEKQLVTGDTEYGSLEELMDHPPCYDLYVCGSDQIWNTAPNDASMAYFLPFAKGHKVSFAPSFGQLGTMKHKEEIARYLRDFDRISVREEYGQKLIYDLIGQNVPIYTDPTILLEPAQWDELAAKPLVKGEYIFYYSLFSSKELITEVKAISKQLGLPVVVSNISNQHDLMTGFQKQTAAGPCEFLSLVKYAKVVVTSSFHGTVFSILYHKPFVVFRGMEDKRICTLLRMMGLEECSFEPGEGMKKVKESFAVNFDAVDQCIKKEQARSMEYIRETLEL